MLNEAVAALTARPSLPPHIDPGVIEDIPEGHGVYLFYAENDLPLYVGKSNTLRKRVLSHFSADHASAKEMSLSQQVRRIEWIETRGELGALLKESELVKTLQPTHNRRLRRNGELCTWRVRQHPERAWVPELVWARDLDAGSDEKRYGLFKNPRDAKQSLKAIAEEQGLCLAMLGMEKLTAGRPCFAHQVHICRGACVGKESIEQHNLRLATSLQALALKPWPYAGPIGIREGDALHVIDDWRFLGTAANDADLHDLLACPRPAFDADAYKLLVKVMGKRSTKIERLRR